MSHLTEITPAVRGKEFKEVMHKHVDAICGHHPAGIAGFAIVAWGFDGSFSRGTRVHKDSFVRQTLMPAFVAEVLRRDTMEDIVHDYFA